MAPLNRDDVLQAAEARSLADPEGFTAELEQHGLVPAANRLACEHLCAEASPRAAP